MSSSPFVFPPTGAERAHLAEQLRQMDAAQAANERVPNYEHVDIAGSAPKQTHMDSSRVTESIPAPSAPTFYLKHSNSPTSGTAVGPDDIVEINVPGLGRHKTSVAVALNMGLIARDASGGYRALSTEERDVKATADEQEQQEVKANESAELSALRLTGDAPDEAASLAIDTAVARVSGGAIQSLVHDVVANGSMSEAAVVRAGERTGMSPEQSKALARSVYEGIERQASRAAQSVGVPAERIDEFYGWAQDAYPLEYKQAVMGLALGSSAQAVKDLAQRFKLTRVLQSTAR